MSIVHIFKNTNQKFYEPYIKFINGNFNPKEHHFIIEKYGDNSSNEIHEANVEFVNVYKYFKLIPELYTADKIILHALMSPRLVMILFLQPWLLKKCYWVVWGSDLYYHVNREKNLRSNINEFVRRKVIKNIGNIVTHIKGDFELAKKWYGAKGKYYYSFLYPSNLYKEYSNTPNREENDKVYVQIGNSADPFNDHIEVLEKLRKYKNQNIEIICPLSYGNREYAAQVISYGNMIFGNKFKFITEFIPLEDYLDLLSKIDIAIFNHNRQQAMGNITTLLGLGKKVYIREEITTWQFCLAHDLKVYSANGDFNDLFEEIDKEIKQSNSENVKEQFSEKKLLKDWKKIFNEDEG